MPGKTYASWIFRFRGSSAFGASVLMRNALRPTPPDGTYTETGYTDARECSECACGAPEGGACAGTLRLYDDGVCGSQFNELSLYSLDEQCVSFFPPGRAIGGKAVTHHQYIPGTCVPSSGEATGEAVPKTDDAVTFCCLPAFYAVE